jgi:predicted Ser/Thr protein kinase
MPCDLGYAVSNTTQQAATLLNQRLFFNVNLFAQELEKLVSKVVGYAPPPGSGTKKINLLLMGGVGSGKSSLVSSLDGIFEGRISRWAS